eukprot:3469972-Rhodomonas_salina.1
MHRTLGQVTVPLCASPYASAALGRLARYLVASYAIFQYHIWRSSMRDTLRFVERCDDDDDDDEEEEEEEEEED